MCCPFTALPLGQYCTHINYTIFFCAISYVLFLITVHFNFLMYPLLMLTLGPSVVLDTKTE